MKHQSKMSELTGAAVVALCLFMVQPARPAADELAVVQPACEYKINPMGLDVTRPRLSWKTQATRRNVLQSAYQIRVSASSPDLASGRRLLWDSGQVRSDASVHVVYGGPALLTGQRIYWQVRCWDQNGKASQWSDPAFWEMGLLQSSDWKARWIEPDRAEDTSRSEPAPVLRRELTLRPGVRQARAYVTSLGLYEVELNGRRVGDQVFTPGWTAYDSRLQYQTYDVTDLLRQGPNAAGVTLGDGWYRGFLGFAGQRNVYGERLALLLQINITYDDGTTETIGSDAAWKSSTGPIRRSDIYNGESYDAWLERPGRTRTGYSDTAWGGVRVSE